MCIIIDIDIYRFIYVILKCINLYWHNYFWLNDLVFARNSILVFVLGGLCLIRIWINWYNISDRPLLLIPSQKVILVFLLSVLLAALLTTEFVSFFKGRALITIKFKILQLQSRSLTLKNNLVWILFVYVEAALKHLFFTHLLFNFHL